MRACLRIILRELTLNTRLLRFVRYDGRAGTWFDKPKALAAAAPDINTELSIVLAKESILGESGKPNTVLILG